MFRNSIEIEWGEGGTFHGEGIFAMAVGAAGSNTGFTSEERNV